MIEKDAQAHKHAQELAVLSRRSVEEHALPLQKADAIPMRCIASVSKMSIMRIGDESMAGLQLFHFPPIHCPDPQQAGQDASKYVPIAVKYFKVVLELFRGEKRYSSLEEILQSFVADVEKIESSVKDILIELAAQDLKPEVRSELKSLSKEAKELRKECRLMTSGLSGDKEALDTIKSVMSRCDRVSKLISEVVDGDRIIVLKDSGSIRYYPSERVFDVEGKVIS